MQIITDLKNAFTSKLTLPPKSQTGNTNGTSADFSNADVRTHAVVSVGTVTDNAVMSVKIQESADNTTFSDVADSGANTGNLNTANTPTVLSFQRTMQYLRGVLTLQGGGNNAAMLIDCLILSEKKWEPAGSGVDRSPST